MVDVCNLLRISEQLGHNNSVIISIHFVLPYNIFPYSTREIIVVSHMVYLPFINIIEKFSVHEVHCIKEQRPLNDSDIYSPGTFYSGC